MSLVASRGALTLAAGRVPSKPVFTPQPARPQRAPRQCAAHVRRLEGTVSKLEAQMGMLAMNKNIAALTKNLQQTLSNNELTKAAKVMEDFDKALEGLELQGMNMSSVMGQQVAQSTPQAQVNDLLSQIADDQGMQLQEDLPGAPSRLVEKEAEKDSLEADLRKLRG